MGGHTVPAVLGTAAGPGSVQPLPLQLLRPITPDNLAGTLAISGASGASILGSTRS